MMKTFYTIIAVASISASGVSSAQDAESSGALKVSQARAEAYIDAFNKADLKTLSALYSEDAVYTNDDATIAGRAAIMEGLTRYVATIKGTKLALNIES